MKKNENLYYYEKSNYTALPYEEISMVDIILDNGRLIRVYVGEVEDFSLELYDRLIVFDGDILPVVKSGKLQLRYNTIKAVASGNRYDFDAAVRLLKEANVINIELITIYDDKYTFCGEIKADITEKECTINFLPNDKYGESKRNNLEIELDDTLQENVGEVMIRFLNDDLIVLSNDDIDYIDLQFESLLTIKGGALQREIKSGYMQIYLEEYSSGRYYINDEELENTIENIERRICGRGYVSTHDIKSVVLKYVDYKVKTFVGEEFSVSGYYTHQEEDSIYGYTVRAESGKIIVSFGEDALSILEDASNDESIRYSLKDDDEYDD